MIKNLFGKSLDAYLKFFVFMGFSVLMIYCILTGDILYYINPRILPLVWLCALSMILIAFVMLLSKKSHTHASAGKFSYLIFIIPLLMGFFVPAKTLSAASFELPLGSGQIADQRVLDVDPGSQSNGNNPQAEIDVQEPSLRKRTSVIVEDRNFTLTLDSMYMRTEEYVGADIEILGKVYREPGMQPNEFAVVRPMMSCCSADTVLVGLFCVNPTQTPVQPESWVKVKGKVAVKDQNEGKIPMIALQSIEPAAKPENEFVYAY